MIGANLSVSSPLRPDCLIGAVRIPVGDTVDDCKLAGCDKSRPARDDGTATFGDPIFAGEAAFERPKRNRSSRISIAANSQTNPE